MITGSGLRKGGWRTRDGQVSAALTTASAAGLIALQRSSQQSQLILEEALTEGLGPEYRDLAVAAGLAPAIGPAIRPLVVTPTWIWRRRLLSEGAICYGPAGKRNCLDIWRRKDLPADGKAPVLLQLPGGGWVSGGTRWQAYPLMAHLVDAGWICVPMCYRLSPRATFPDHIIDVKRAIAWIKANIASHGGDPNFVVITGGSAGGHLTALAALSANAPDFQPGFEDADTRVQAAVPFYGIYDLLDWDDKGGPKANVRYVERFLMKVSPSVDPERWRRASPVSWVNADAPPMMILHGRNDSLVPVESARRFASELKAVSKEAVVYAELPAAQHAFDIYASLRTRYTVRAVEQFLAFVRATNFRRAAEEERTVSA